MSAKLTKEDNNKKSPNRNATKNDDDVKESDIGVAAQSNPHANDNNHFPFNQLEKLLTCPICLDRYRQPKLLPCQHTYCLECLENMADYYKRIVKCAECRTENILPYKGVETFPNNLTILSFLELPSVIAVEEAKSGNSNLMLLQETNSRRGSRRSVTDEASNDRLGQYTSHLPSAQRSSYQTTTQSPTQQYRFVKLETCPICNENTELFKCLHCDRKVCNACKESHLEQMQREVIRLLTNTQRNVPKLEETINVIEQKLANMKNNFNFVKNEIKMEIDRCVRELNNRERVLLEEVDNLMESEIRKMTERQGTLSTEKEEIESYCQRTATRLNQPTLPSSSSPIDNVTGAGATSNNRDSHETTSNEGEEDEDEDDDEQGVQIQSLKTRIKNAAAAKVLLAAQEMVQDNNKETTTNNINTTPPPQVLPEIVPLTPEELVTLKQQISTYLDHIRDINVEAVESYKRMKFIADNNMLRSNILTFGELHVRSVVHSGNLTSKTTSSPNNETTSSRFSRSYSFENDDTLTPGDNDNVNSTLDTTGNYKSGSNRYTSPAQRNTGSTATPTRTSRFLNRPRSTYETTATPSSYDYSSSSRRAPIGSSSTPSQDDIFAGYLGNEVPSSVTSSTSPHTNKNWRTDAKVHPRTLTDLSESNISPKFHRLDVNRFNYADIYKMASPKKDPIKSVVISNNKSGLPYSLYRSKTSFNLKNSSTIKAIEKSLSEFNANKIESAETLDTNNEKGGSTLETIEDENRRDRELHKSYYRRKYGRCLTTNNVISNATLNNYDPDINFNDYNISSIKNGKKLPIIKNSHFATPDSPLSYENYPHDTSINADHVNGYANNTNIYRDNKDEIVLDALNHNDRLQETNGGSNEINVHKEAHKSMAKRKLKKNFYQRSKTDNNNNINHEENRIEPPGDHWWKSWLIDDGEVKTRAEKKLEQLKHTDSHIGKDAQTSYYIDHLSFPDCPSRSYKKGTTTTLRNLNLDSNLDSKLKTYGNPSSSSSVEYLQNPPIKLRMEQKRRQQHISDTNRPNLVNNNPISTKSFIATNINNPEYKFDNLTLNGMGLNSTADIFIPETDVPISENFKISESLKNKFNTLQRFKRRNEFLMNLASVALFSPDGTCNDSNYKYVPIRERIHNIRANLNDSNIKDETFSSVVNTGNASCHKDEDLKSYGGKEKSLKSKYVNHLEDIPNDIIFQDHIEGHNMLENADDKPGGIPSTSQNKKLNKIADNNSKVNDSVNDNQSDENVHERQILDNIFETELRAYIQRINDMQKDIEQFADEIQSHSSLKNYETPDLSLSPANLSDRDLFDLGENDNDTRHDTDNGNTEQIGELALFYDHPLDVYESSEERRELDEDELDLFLNFESGRAIDTNISEYKANSLTGPPHSILIKHESRSSPYQRRTSDTGIGESNHRIPKENGVKLSKKVSNGSEKKVNKVKRNSIGNIKKQNDSLNIAENGVYASLNVKVNPSNKGGFVSLKIPMGLALSTNGTHLFVADKGNHKIRMMKLQLGNGKAITSFVKSYGIFGYTPEKLNRPCDVALGYQDQIAIADSGNHKVVCLNSELKFQRILGTGEKGHFNGQFEHPTGVTFDSMGFIYVCDKLNRRVQVFSGDGIFVGKWGHNHLTAPKRVHYSSHRSIIYVTDAGDHSLKLFDRNGIKIGCVNKIPKVLTTPSTNGANSAYPLITENFSYPSSVSCYSANSENIILLDSGNDRVIQLTADGRVIQVFPLISSPVLTSSSDQLSSTLTNRFDSCISLPSSMFNNGIHEYEQYPVQTFAVSDTINNQIVFV
ncbi:unnamed protein product [Gordionus sp. m RMFG-2023]|uniref:putative uncharacterized protein DDB_G0282133 n=1 Tax=Gordionus sp. m RMFG-2023 TaxID=3053472 RepID=UPI0030E57951